MATIYKEAPINVTVDQLWEALSDVGNIHNLLSYLEGTEMDGDYRSCSMEGGASMRELIISVDSDRRRLAYSVVEEPFGFEHHSASFRAVPDGGKTLFVWETDVKPDSVVEALEPLIDQSITDIRAAVEALHSR